MCGTITSISLPDLGACIGQWKLIDDIKTQVSINWQIFPLANIFLVGFQPSLVEQGYWYAFSIRLSPETPLAEIVYVLQWPANDSQLSWNIFNITKTNVTIIGRIPSIINQFQSWITSGSLVVQLTLNTSDIMSFFNGNKCFYIVYMRGQFYGNQPLPPDDIILNKSLCISCQVVNIMPTVNLNNTTYTTITRTLPPLSSAVDVSTIGSTATSVFNVLWSGRITNMLWSNDCYNLTSSCSQNLTASLQKAFCSLSSNGSASSFTCHQFILNSLKPGSILFSSTATVSSQLPQNSVVAFISNGLANVSSSNSSLLQFDPASNNLTNAPAVILTTPSESITNVDNTTIASRASTLTAVISSPGISTNKNVFPTDETTGTIYSSTAGSLATTQSPSGGTVGNSGSSTVVSTNTTEAVISASIGSIFSSTAGSLATTQSQSGGTVDNIGSSTVGSLATTQSQSGGTVDNIGSSTVGSLATTQFQSSGTVGNIGSSAAVTQLSSASSLSNSTANGGISMSVSIANSHASTVVSTTTNGLSSAPLITSNGYATTILTANSSSASVFNLSWSGRITNMLWSNDCYNLTSSCSQNLTASLQKVFCSLSSNGSASSFTCDQFILNSLKPGSILFSSTATVSSQSPQNSIVANLNSVLSNMNSSSGSVLQFDPASNNLTVANSPQVTTNTTTPITANLTTTSPGNENSGDSSWQLIVGCVVGIGGFLILFTIILSVYICIKYRRQRSVPFNRGTQGKLKYNADVYKSLGDQHPTIGSESPDIIVTTAF
ncbi:unnamed protein product [Rotaria socialis]|uniref:Uncharacterized protein n=3 Tax=Rotaria socialis TaxID=392032 RepID=A0A820AIN0_9BILA|nr:unnamed protein product [Rotaria socialis]